MILETMRLTGDSRLSPVNMVRVCDNLRTVSVVEEVVVISEEDSQQLILGLRTKIDSDQIFQLGMLLQKIINHADTC